MILTTRFSPMCFGKPNKKRKILLDCLAKVLYRSIQIAACGSGSFLFLFYYSLTLIAYFFHRYKSLNCHSCSLGTTLCPSTMQTRE